MSGIYRCFGLFGLFGLYKRRLSSVEEVFSVGTRKPLVDLVTLRAVYLSEADTYTVLRRFRHEPKLPEACFRQNSLGDLDSSSCLARMTFFR